MSIMNMSKRVIFCFSFQKIHEQLIHNITTFRQLIAVIMCPGQKPPAGFGLLLQGTAWLWNGIQPAGYRWKFRALIHGVRFLVWCSQWGRPLVTLKIFIPRSLCHVNYVFSEIMLNSCDAAHMVWICQGHTAEVLFLSFFFTYPHIS